MSRAARSTPGAPAARSEVAVSSGRSARACVDVEPQADDDAVRRPLAQQPGELAVPVAGHEHVVGPLQRGLHPGHLGHGPVHGEPGEQRHPRRPGCRRRHEDRHREGGARGRRPRPTETPATGILMFRDDDAPEVRRGADLVVRGAEPLENLHGTPRCAGCDGSLVERSRGGVLAHGLKARLGSCPQATPSPSVAPTSRRTSTPRRPQASSPTSSAGWPRWRGPGPREPSTSSTPAARRPRASGWHSCWTRAPSSRWTSTRGTVRSRSAATATAPTATGSSPATGPSTGAPSRCSPRTSRSSAGPSARSSARRSPRSWTSR